MKLQVRTKTRQHFTISHCFTILRNCQRTEHSPLQNTTDMFSNPVAAEVLPRSKNHGLKPSEDFASMILRCCTQPLYQPNHHNKPRTPPTHLWEIGDDQADTEARSQDVGEYIVLL